MRVTIASVSSHLVVRTWHFWKIKEKKIEKKINIDLAIIASQSSEKQFMTPWLVYRQEIIWMVRQRVQLSVLAEVGEELEAVEECETSRRDEREANCSPQSC